LSDYIIPFEDGTNPEDIYSRENFCIEKIRSQVTGSEFTGDVRYEPNYILEYIESVFSEEDPNTIIQEFEEICGATDKVEEHDHLLSGIKSVFQEHVGVTIESEEVYFADIYDIYIAFVLSLKDTVERSTINHYTDLNESIGKKDMVEKISDYCLSDDTSLPDDFIRNAAVGDANTSLVNINEKIESFQIAIDHDTLSKYLFHFIETAL
jgi:hypothetical protein